MTKFEQDGQEFEFVRWGNTEPNDYFIGHQGDFIHAESGGFCALEVPIFRKKMKRHVIGGVEFEETGEVRPPEAGDWYLFHEGKGVGHWGSRSFDFPLTSRPILRRIV